MTGPAAGNSYRAVAKPSLVDSRCSLQTWVYRVAHNVAASHILRQRRVTDRLVSLEALAAEPGSIDGEAQAHQQYSASRLLDRIYSLQPLDRQVLLLYLEGEPAVSIAEVTGLSATHVATKIHRLRSCSAGSQTRE
jgi:RNA polymerase sigma-70 factor (ECF subfamily)